jgi:predicted transcriptional regulator
VAERLNDQLTIRVAATERVALEHMAHEQNRSVAYLARSAIQLLLDTKAAAHDAEPEKREAVLA